VYYSDGACLEEFAMKQLVLLLVLIVMFDSAQDQRPALRSAIAGVLIDVTVIDKDGHPVTDLIASDFEILEDGKPQRIVSATLMQGGVPAPLAGAATVAAPAATSAAAEPPTPSGAVPLGPTPAIVAILFESLSADSRPYAAKAAAALVSTLTPPNEYAGVFLGGLAFKTVQPFTNNPADVRSALNRVAVTASNDLNVDREEPRTSSRISGLDPSTPITAGAEYGRGYTTIHEREQLLRGPDGQLRRIEYTMEEGYKRMLAELEGDAALASLRVAVEGLALVPGRKSILYFAEGLPITSRLKSRFDELVAAANRANVTIYPVDAVGLRPYSKESEVARNLNLDGAHSIVAPGSLTTKDLEKQEEMLASRPATSLGRLANETGGFLIDNTNDLGKGVARMHVERMTYYLLGYQSTNPTMDGKFRKVTVKVRRGKYTTRARPGYVAVTR
jgi:VWFA-related protein